MGANTLALLGKLSSILLSIEAGVSVFQRVVAVINKARAENRDITDEELDAVMQETETLEADTLAKLKAASTLD